MADIFTNITARGTKSLFKEAMADAPNVWRKHAGEVKSDSPDENYVWLGTLPIPVQYTDGTSIQGLNDFTFTVENLEYRMAFLIELATSEDAKHGMIQSRIAEAAKVWAHFYDSLFGALLIAGETSPDTFDATTFHDTTRTIGASGTINNSQTSDITTVNSPTVAELLVALKAVLDAMWRFNDDQGRPFNLGAMSKLAAVIPPEHHKIFTEVIGSELLSQSSNPWAKNLLEFDVTPYLTDADDAFYVSALGAERKPFYFQERTPLMVEVFNTNKEMLENGGLKVIARQRLRFAYGDPRRNIRHDFT